MAAAPRTRLPRRHQRSVGHQPLPRRRRHREAARPLLQPGRLPAAADGRDLRRPVDDRPRRSSSPRAALEGGASLHPEGGRDPRGHRSAHRRRAHRRRRAARDVRRRGVVGGAVAGDDDRGAAGLRFRSVARRQALVGGDDPARWRRPLHRRDRDERGHGVRGGVLRADRGTPGRAATRHGLAVVLDRDRRPPDDRRRDRGGVPPAGGRRGRDHSHGDRVDGVGPDRAPRPATAAVGRPVDHRRQRRSRSSSGG